MKIQSSDSNSPKSNSRISIAGINIGLVLDYAIVLLLILGTNSVYAVTVRNFRVKTLILIVLFLRIITFNLSERYVKRFLYFVTFWVAYIFLFIAMNPFEAGKFINNFLIFFILLVGYLLFYQAEGNLLDLLRIFSNIIFCIAVISLFFWLFGSMLHIIKPTGTMPMIWGGTVNTSTYFGVYFQWQNDAVIMGHRIFRNIGIFAEAPMYSLNLSVAFMFDYLFNKRRHLLRMLIYVVTIMTSVSYTGILFVMILVVGEQSLKYVVGVIRGERSRVGAAAVLVVLIVAAAIAYRLLAAKLASGSGSSRIDDYISGFRAWLDNFFWGSGYGDISVRVQYSSARRLARSATGFTNSIMTVLSQGGLYLGAVYGFSFIVFLIKAIQMKSMEIFILDAMWVFLFLTTTFGYSPLMVAFLAMATAITLAQVRWSKQSATDLAFDVSERQWFSNKSSLIDKQLID